MTKIYGNQRNGRYNMVIFCVFFNKKLEEYEYKKLINFLSPEEKSRIHKFKKWQDANRTMIGRLLIRSVVCNKYSFKNNCIFFQVNEYGKSYIVNLSNMHFNIAHSGCWVVCEVDSRPVGVDIEKIQSIDLNIAKKFFSMEEYMDLLKKEENDRLSYFFDLWTLKESYIKAEEMGLSIPLDSFTIKKENEIINMIGGDKTYHFKQYEISDEYKLSLASTSDDFPTKPTCFNLNTFVEFRDAALGGTV